MCLCGFERVVEYKNMQLSCETFRVSSTEIESNFNGRTEKKFLCVQHEDEECLDILFFYCLTTDIFVCMTFFNLHARHTTYYNYTAVFFYSTFFCTPSLTRSLNPCDIATFLDPFFCNIVSIGQMRGVLCF